MKRCAVTLLVLIFLAALVIVATLHGNCVMQDRDAILAPASLHHWAGTDDLGRDRAARIAAALLLGSVAASIVAAITTSIAIAVALGVAFTPSAIGYSLVYAADVCLALPWLFLLMLVRSVLPLNLSATASGAVTFLLLAVLGWPIYVRGLSARLAAVRNAEWLLHARASGTTTLRMAWRHVLPHLRPLYRTQFLLCIPACILAEADLGAIGFGMSEPLVSWGTLLQELGSSAQVAATHWVYLPLALLLVSLLSFELLFTEE